MDHCGNRVATINQNKTEIAIWPRAIITIGKAAI